MSDDHEERSGIRVTDRRRFSDTGEPRDEVAGQAAEDTPPEASPRGEAAPAPDAPVSFSAFILGLSTQALMHLGEVEHPVTGTKDCDLPAAQHVIDVLGVLSVKTSGNLDAAEQALMESVLYDLRMRYVDLVRGGGDAEKTKEKA